MRIMLALHSKFYNASKSSTMLQDLQDFRMKLICFGVDIRFVVIIQYFATNFLRKSSIFSQPQLITWPHFDALKNLQCIQFSHLKHHACALGNYVFIVARYQIQFTN
eukprot:TRINITY_DN2064_c0_g3_i2.p5 TRINITY_DN2064_c0_g3~~TRINITY_DN2064_c0_g3_i2.p5  ORF type:complete len:107 (+),score=1.79 TRINITY_DN2064_c0_g3_i2:741-1061(+)